MLTQSSLPFSYVFSCDLILAGVLDGTALHTSVITEAFLGSAVLGSCLSVVGELAGRPRSLPRSAESESAGESNPRLLPAAVRLRNSYKDPSPLSKWLEGRRAASLYAASVDPRDACSGSLIRCRNLAYRPGK